MNQKLVIFLWFDGQAEEAVNFYQYWEQLSAEPEAEQCGWLVDKFGISWQIVPTILQKLLGDKDRKKAENVTRVMLQMKKIDRAKLEEAFAQA